MKEGPDIARLAALIGDPARANILGALMGGKALSAGELARHAGVSAATASGHLAQLMDADLIGVRKQGRHRYFALSDPEVAAALEGLSALAASKGGLRTRTGPRDAELRHARMCYDHLAGVAAVEMFDSMARRGFLEVTGGAVALSRAGADFVRGLGVDLGVLEAGRRPLCRICLDWSERRSHLGGALGAGIVARFEAEGWLTRQQESRRVRFTAQGARALAAHFPA